MHLISGHEMLFGHKEMKCILPRSQTCEQMQQAVSDSFKIKLLP